MHPRHSFMHTALPSPPLPSFRSLEPRTRSRPRLCLRTSPLAFGLGATMYLEYGSGHS